MPHTNTKSNQKLQTLTETHYHTRRPNGKKNEAHTVEMEKQARAIGSNNNRKIATKIVRQTLLSGNKALERAEVRTDLSISNIRR